MTEDQRHEELLLQAEHYASLLDVTYGEGNPRIAEVIRGLVAAIRRLDKVLEDTRIDLAARVAVQVIERTERTAAGQCYAFPPSNGSVD